MRRYVPLSSLSPPARVAVLRADKSGRTEPQAKYGTYALTEGVILSAHSRHCAYTIVSLQGCLRPWQSKLNVIRPNKRS